MTAGSRKRHAKHPATRTDASRTTGPRAVVIAVAIGSILAVEPADAREAVRSELKGMTGIDAPCEPPEHADLVVDTANQSVEESVAVLLAFVRNAIAPG